MMNLSSKQCGDAHMAWTSQQQQQWQQQEEECASSALCIMLVRKRINQSKRTRCNKQKTNATEQGTKKTIHVHAAAAMAWATEQRKKKWVNGYKAISSFVVFLLWSRASYATDVRKSCVNISRGNYYYFWNLWPTERECAREFCKKKETSTHTKQ